MFWMSNTLCKGLAKTKDAPAFCCKTLFFNGFAVCSCCVSPDHFS